MDYRPVTNKELAIGFEPIISRLQIECTSCYATPAGERVGVERSESEPLNFRASSRIRTDILWVEARNSSL